MTTPTNKVISVEILHLDELGYGPQGKHTRRAWRAECLENLMAGKEVFEAWQDSWKDQLEKPLPQVNYECVLNYDDGSTQQAYFNADPMLLDFSGQQFDSRLDLTQFNVRHAVSFRGAMFMQDAVFNNTTFDKKAMLDSVTFRARAFFRDTVFHNLTYFSGTIFCDLADFSVTTFNGVTNFDYVRFATPVDFSDSKFEEWVSFIFSTFELGVSFCRTIFKNSMVFSNVTINELLDFSGATFSGVARFAGVKVKAYGNFRLTTFNQQCRFDNELQQWDKAATFTAGADFESAIFKNVGHFEGVKFTNKIPSFLGVDTASTRLEFSDDSHFAWHDVTEDAVKRLGHLKRLADEHGQIDQALTFNALELHAKAAQPTASFANKLVTGAYALFSNYGRSFGLPIFWLGFMLWLSFLFALGNYNQYKSIVPNVQCANLAQNITISKPRAAFEYAMFRASGVLDFTDADKQNHAVNCALFKQPIEPWWMRIWGIFKAIVSLALLFLAALGLRNNYRIK